MGKQRPKERRKPVEDQRNQTGLWFYTRVIDAGIVEGIVSGVGREGVVA